LSSTSVSFSVRLPGGRVTFSCVAKRKSPKRRPPREHALRPSMGYGCARARRGSPKAHPCACGELAHLLCATLRAIPSSARRVRGAPFGALPARTCRQSKQMGPAPHEAMDGRWWSDNRAVGGAAAAMPIARARRACPTAGMQEFAPARDRQAAREAEATGRCRCRRHRRNGLWLLSAETESSLLAAEASETNAKSPGRARWIPACAGMTEIDHVG